MSTGVMLVASLGLGACCIGRAAPPQSGPNISSPDSRVGRFEPIEFRIDVPASVGAGGTASNLVEVEFTHGRAGQITVPAFLSQAYEHRWVEEGTRRRAWMYPTGLPAWRARFAPPALGRYSAVAVVQADGRELRSAPVRFECVASTNHGFIQVSRRDPRFLEFSDGTPFFPIGQNLAFVGEGQYVTLAKAESIFAQLAANGANYLRIWAGCEDWAIGLEARKSAWGRSWNWRPPLVPTPGRPAEGPRCLRLTATNRVLKVDPSHAVALRPATRYVVRARILTEPGSTLRLTVQGTRTEALPSADAKTWRDVRHEFDTGSSDFWLRDTSWQCEGEGRAWLADLSLREAVGGPELLWEADVNRPVRGSYNPIDAFLLDRLFASARRHGLYVQLCLATRDVYMDALKDPSSPDYDQAVGDAQRLLRYAVGRWGCYTSLAAWEYWNEMNPNLPTDRFYREVGEALEQLDPFHHLRTTSTWGPSEKDCRHPELDLADVHFYLRPTDRPRLRDEVEAVLDRASWLRQHAPNRPAHLGEFGLANDQWQPTAEMQRRPKVIDFKHGLWASALSGTTGTALFWWWDRLDQRHHYPLYRPLSRFLAEVPWTSGDICPFQGLAAGERVRVIGLRARERAWIWLFNREAAWDRVVVQQKTPSWVAGAEFVLENQPGRRARLEWWNTDTGQVQREERVQVEQGQLRLHIPDFATDIALKIMP